MELQLDLTKRYTYADYLTWLDDTRRELIDGAVRLLFPAPRRIHQKVLKMLSVRIENFLYQKKCEVYFAPFDVRLPKNGEKDGRLIYTVVQPDICVICDPAKLDDKGCLGAPDLIIEIVSPSNSKHDVDTKFHLYQRHGVREYWIVFPDQKIINVFILNDKDKYEIVGMYTEESKVPVNIFNGELEIDLAEVFDE